MPIRNLLWLAAGVLGVVGIAALFMANPGKGGDANTVRLAIPSKGAAFWPNYVAERKGFYRRAGLRVDQQEIDPNITVSSLIGNAVDIAYADSTQLMFALEKHSDLVAVGLSTDRHPYRLMAGPAITSIARLKGKKVGAASEIDVYTAVLRIMLRNAGLDPAKDVTWVYGGNQTKRLAIMNAGLIDAGFFSPPADARLKGRGFKALAFAPDLFPHLTLSTQTVRRDWAAGHGEVLRRLLKAQVAALDWLYDPANKAEALDIIKSETGAKGADAEEAYTYFVAAHVWQDGCVQRAGLETVVKVMRDARQLHLITEKDVPKFSDPQWCPR